MDALEAYGIWLKKQRELEPVLPIRYMSELANVAQGTVQRYIKQLIEMELIEEVPFGKNKVQYRMIERQ